MDVRYLVISLTRAAVAAGAPDGGTPEVAVRMEKDFSGGHGEAYLLKYPDMLLLVERCIGDPDYRCVKTALDKVSVIGREDSAFELSCEGKTFRCDYSWSEKDAAGAFLAAMEASPAVLLTAALMFAAGSDGELPQVQEEFLRSLVPRDQVLVPGMQFYHDHSADECADLIARSFSDVQKEAMCVAMLELLFVDGEYRSDEQEFLRDFTAGCGIAPTDLETIERIMLARSNLGEIFNFNPPA